MPQTEFVVSWQVEGESRYKTVTTVLECSELVRDLQLMGFPVKGVYAPLGWEHVIIHQY